MVLKIRSFSIPIQILREMSERERVLFLLGGHVANEMMILMTLYVMATQSTLESNIHGHAAATQRLLVFKILAGKLHEAWAMIKKYYHGNGGELSKEYEVLLDAKALAHLKTIKKHMKSEGAIRKVRNRFSFHYGHTNTEMMIKSLDEMLDGMSDDGDLKMYINERIGNSLYYFADSIVNGSMLRDINADDPTAAIKELGEDVKQVMCALVPFLNSFMGAVTKKYLVKARDRAEIIEVDAPKVETFSLPFFVEWPQGKLEK